MKLVTQGPYSKNVGSRLYLLDSSSNKYEKLQLLNKEFTFDVKVSDLDCGLNGALYLVEMDADGGMSHSGKYVLGTIHILRHHIFGIFGPPSSPTSACF